MKQLSTALILLSCAAGGLARVGLAYCGSAISWKPPNWFFDALSVAGVPLTRSNLESGLFYEVQNGFIWQANCTYGCVEGSSGDSDYCQQKPL